MPKKSFDKVVDRQLLRGENPFKNPRNAAAGSLRQKDSSVTATRGLDIFVFNIQQIEGAQLTSHKQSIDFIKELGFHTIPTYKKVDNIEDAISEIDRIGEARGSLEYDIDGAVIKVRKDNSSALPQNILNGRLLLNIRRKKNKQY